MEGSPKGQEESDKKLFSGHKKPSVDAKKRWSRIKQCLINLPKSIEESLRSRQVTGQVKTAPKKGNQVKFKASPKASNAAAKAAVKAAKAAKSTSVNNDD